MKRKLLILGGSYMNLQMKINPKTRDNNTTFGAEYRFHPFGDSAVTAISAGKLGGECVFGTRFGDDTNGKRLYEYYKSCGLKTDLMKKDKNAQTGMSITLFSDLETHENYVSAGASAHFTKEEIDDAFVTMPDLFLVPLEELGLEKNLKTMSMNASAAPSLETESETDGSRTGIAEVENRKDGQDGAKHSDDSVSHTATYMEHESLALYALHRACDRGVELLLQYTPFTARFPLEKLDNIKILVITDEMLYAATGFFPNTTEKALRSLVALSQKIKAKYYVVQQNSGKCFVYDGKYYEVITAPSQLSGLMSERQTMSQTFLGALATEYLESKHVVRACRFAIIASLMTRSKFGNLEKAPSKAELEQYASEHGFDLYRG